MQLYIFAYRKEDTSDTKNEYTSKLVGLINGAFVSYIYIYNWLQRKNINVMIQEKNTSF